MSSPILWGPNNLATNLENGILGQNNGTLLSYNGPKNYISYNNFENNATTGWSLFNTTLTGVLPTGSISAGASSITFATITTGSGAIGGNFSLQVSAASAWSAGQGFISDAFTIDTESQAKVMTFSFYYQVATIPLGVTLPGTSSNTLAVYIYDTTASAWIQPAGVYSMTQTSGVGFATGTFQTTSSSTQYRLAVIAINAGSAVTQITFDDFFLGPQTAPIGAPITDWTNSGANTISAVTTPPTKGTATITADNLWWRRVGGNMEVRIEYKQTAAGSATAGSGDYLFQIPTGYTIDTTKVTVYGGASLGENTAAPQSSNSVGFGLISSTNLIAKSAGVLVYDSTHIRLAGTDSSTGGGAGQGAVGSAFAPLSNAAVTYAVSFSVPISGWSSNVQMSNDTDTRVIALEANKSAGAITANTTIPTWTNVVQDTAGGFNSSSGVYTIQVSGSYFVNFSLMTTTGTPFGQIYKNGALYQTLNGGGSTSRTSGAVLIPCVAGDTITVASNTTLTVATSTTETVLSIFRLSGPAVIAATESVNGLYTDTSGTSLNAAALTNYTYPTKIRDSHNAYSSGTLTIPVSGMYQFSASYVTAAITSTTSNRIRIAILRNGSIISLQDVNGNGVSNEYSIQTSAYYPCNAGDTITVQQFYSNAGATISTTAGYNNFNWARIGN